MNNIPSENYFQKILVGVDGSETALLAEELAVVLAKKFPSKVTAVHAVPEQLLDLGVKTPSNIPRAVIEEVSQWFVAKADDILKNTQALFTEENVEVDTRILHGDAAENIIVLAAKEKYDLIILGNRGETEAEVYALGSTAEKISRHAGCTVLIVKQKSIISKILVAVDGSENANKGLQYAVQLAKALNSDITIMNIVEHRLFGLQPEAAQKAGQQTLSEALNEVKGVNVVKRLEVGHPAEKIIEISNKEDFDLIVVGNRGLSRAKRFLLGSVSDDISHHAHCSVLVAR